MFEDLLKTDYLDRLKESAEKHIMEDRKNFAPILLIALDYIIKQDVFVDIPDILIDPDFDITEKIKNGSIESLDIYSNDAQKTAKELAVSICQKIGDEMILNVMVEQKEYRIDYDTRWLINIYLIVGTVPIHKTKNIFLFPMMLETINILFGLIDVANFTEWPNMLKKIHAYEKYVKFPDVVEWKPSNKKVQDIRTLLLQYIQGSKHVILNASCEHAIDIIATAEIESVMTEFSQFIDKYSNLDIYFKNTQIYIPKQSAFEKYSVFITSEDMPICNVYNLGTYSLIPYDGTDLRIAAPVVQCFILLINIWISCNRDKEIRKDHIKSYKENLAKIKIKKYHLAGTYISSSIKKKIDKLKKKKTGSERSNYGCTNLEDSEE